MEALRLGCLGGGARNDSHQVVCRFFMCRFAGTQPGGSGLERAGSHGRSFLVWVPGVSWAETLSLGAWAALEAALETILIKWCVGFSCIGSRGRSLEDLAWREPGRTREAFWIGTRAWHRWRLCAWAWSRAALAAVQNAIKGKRRKDFAPVSGRMV